MAKRGRGFQLKAGVQRALMVAAALHLAHGGRALALPTGPQVAAGAAQFASPAANALQITNTPGTVINWQSFSIAPNELVRFVQQNAASAVLNRVTGAQMSEILGRLQSNGRVFLVNPNGILIGPGAVVDVAGLVASTLPLSDRDFLDGRLRFSGQGGAIVNQGAVRAGPGGSVLLVGPDIRNEGLIEAPGGSITLAAGRSVTLTALDGSGVSFEVQAPADAVVNLGRLEAGAVNAFAGTLRHSGEVRARSLARDEGGQVVLRGGAETTLAAGSRTLADGAAGGQIRIESSGTTSVEGTVSAMGGSGTGGRIDVLGERVALAGAASVDASGAAGGGSVRIGGGLQGREADARNATMTYVAPEATVRADATAHGDGGRVIVWADDTTRAYGQISARGGEAGGNGGFAEVSGKRFLDFDTRVDLSAPAGRGGTLLLDPYDVEIGNFESISGGTGSGSPWLWTPNATPSRLKWSTIGGLLADDTSVVVTTLGDGGGSGVGNITVTGNSGTLSGNGSLSLLAQGSIRFNGAVSLPEGTLSLAAGWDGGSLTDPAVTAGIGRIEQATDGALKANTLLARAGGAVDLGTAVNQVANVAGQAGGTFRLVNGNALTVTEAGGVSGVTATGLAGGSALVDLAVSAGSLTVLQPVTARGDSYSPVALQSEVRLSAAGDVQVLGNTSRDPATLVLAEGGPGLAAQARGARVTLSSTGGQVTVNRAVVRAQGGDTDAGVVGAPGGAAAIEVTAAAGRVDLQVGARLEAAGGRLEALDAVAAGAAAGSATITVSGRDGIGVAAVDPNTPPLDVSLTAIGGASGVADGDGGAASIVLSSESGAIRIAQAASATLTAAGGAGGAGGDAQIIVYSRDALELGNSADPQSPALALLAASGGQGPWEGGVGGSATIALSTRGVGSPLVIDGGSETTGNALISARGGDARDVGGAALVTLDSLGGLGLSGRPVLAQGGHGGTWPTPQPDPEGGDGEIGPYTLLPVEAPVGRAGEATVGLLARGGDLAVSAQVIARGGTTLEGDSATGLLRLHVSGEAGFDRDILEPSRGIQFNALDITTEHRAIDLRRSSESLVRFSPGDATLTVPDSSYGLRSLRFHNTAGDLSPQDIFSLGGAMAVDLQAAGAILGRPDGAFAVGTGVSRLSLSAPTVGSAGQPVNVHWSTLEAPSLAVTAGTGGAHVDIYRAGGAEDAAPLDLSLTVANADARIRWGGLYLAGPLDGSLVFVAETASLHQAGVSVDALVPRALAFRNSAGPVLPGALVAGERIALTASDDIRATESLSALRLTDYAGYDRTPRIDLDAGGSIGQWEVDAGEFTPLGVRLDGGGTLTARAAGARVAIRNDSSSGGPGSVVLAVGQTDARIDLDSGGDQYVKYRGGTGAGRLDARAMGADLRFEQTAASGGHVNGGQIEVGGSLRIETASGHIGNIDSEALMRADGGLVLRAPTGRIGGEGGSDRLRTRAPTIDVAASGSIRLANDGLPSALAVTTAGQDVDVRRSHAGGAGSNLLEFSRSNSVLDVDAPDMQMLKAISFVNTDAATGIATRDVKAGFGTLRLETAGHLRNHSSGQPLIVAGDLTLRADQGIGGPNPTGNPADRPLAIRLDNGSGSGVLTLDNRSSTAGAYVINETGLANPLLDLTTRGGDLRVDWVAGGVQRRVDYRAAEAGAFTLDAGAQPVRFTQAAGDLSVHSVFNAGSAVPLTLRATGHILMASGAEDPVTVTGALSLHAGGDIGQADAAVRAQAPGVWSLAGRSVHADNLAAPAAVLVATGGGEAHVTWAGLGGTTTNRLQASLSPDRSTTRVSVAGVGGEGSLPADYANRALAVTNRAGHVEIGDIQAPDVRLSLAAQGDIRDSTEVLSSLAVGSGGSVSLASATGSIDVRSIGGDPLHTAVRVNIPDASDRSARVEWTDSGDTSRIGYVGSGLLSIEAPTSGSAISFVNGPLSVASPSTAAWRSAVFGDHDLQVGMVNAPLSAVTLATSGTIRQPNPGDPALAGSLRLFALNGIYGGSVDTDGAGTPFSAVTDQLSAYNLRANGSRIGTPNFFELYRADGIRLRASPTIDGGDVTVLRGDGLFGAAEPGGALSDAQRAQAGLSAHDAFGAGIRNGVPRGDVRLTVPGAEDIGANGLRVGDHIHSSNGDVVLTADRIDLQAMVRNREPVYDFEDEYLASRRIQFRPATGGRALEVCASECTLPVNASLRLDPEQLSSRVDATWIVLGDSEALSGEGQAIVPPLLRISEALDLTFQGRDYALQESGLALLGGEISQRSIPRDGAGVTEAPLVADALVIVSGGSVGADVDLQAEGNRIGRLSGEVASLNLRNAQALEVGAGGGYGGLTVVDPYQIKVTGGHLTVASGATLSGSGSIELDTGKRLDNLGTVQLRPLAASGNAGTLSINRDFVNASSGTLALSIGGATAGSGADGYDQLQVGGSATLGGALVATLANGFTPSGQSFDLVRAGTATGTFATRDLPAGLEEGLLRTGSPVVSVFRLTHTGENCPSEVICWDGGAGTTRWTDAANWRGDTLPGSGDRVALRLPGMAVTHDQDGTTSTVQSIDAGAGTQLGVSAGTLTVSGTTHASTLAGGLAVEGGTLNVDGPMNAASVAQSGGTLSVRDAGSLTTDALAQSGGTLQLAGSMAQASAGAFAQSGGTVNGTGNFTVDGSFTQSSGGSIDTTGAVSITQSSGTLTVGGGVSGRSVSLMAGAGSVRIDAPVASTTGTLAIEAVGASSDVQVQAGVSSASGLIDIDAGRDILIDQTVTSSDGMVSLLAGRDVRARADVTTAGALVAFAGGEVRIEDARVQAGETAIVLADAVSVLASESSASLGAGGDLGVAANGALLVRGGAAEGASASIYSGSGDFILSARGITLVGGAGRYASAVLSGNPDVDLTLTAGSSLALVPGSGEFASARVEAFLPTTILLDLRGNPVGGFSVAGVANSVFHEPSGSGLFANGGPAVRGDSLKVFYNGIPEGQSSTPPPIDPASLVLAALAQGGAGGAQRQPDGGGSGPDAGSGAAETSTEEGTTILLLRPRPPAQCN